MENLKPYLHLSKRVNEVNTYDLNVLVPVTNGSSYSELSGGSIVNNELVGEYREITIDLNNAGNSTMLSHTETVNRDAMLERKIRVKIQEAGSPKGETVVVYEDAEEEGSGEGNQ